MNDAICPRCCGSGFIGPPVATAWGPMWLPCPACGGKRVEDADEPILMDAEEEEDSCKSST